MENKLIIEIPIEARSKKNHNQLVMVKGRMIVIPSKQYKEFEKECQPYMPKLDKPIDYPINLKCTFYMKTRRKVDLSNLINAVADILTHFKVLEDDNRNIVASFDGSIVLYDKDNPKTIIELTKKDDYEQW